MADDTWVESWMLSLHDKADGTKSEYRANVGHFARWLATAKPGFSSDLLEATRQDVEGWFTALAEAGIGQQTRRNRWVSLRAFYGWLVDEDEIDANPMDKVKVARPAAPPVPVLSVDDLKAMLRACEGKAFRERRDMALLRTFLSTGCRLNEVAGMALADVDLTARLGHVMGKGSKPRTVRFDAQTAAAIDRYRRARARHHAHREPWLWVGTKGRLTKSGIDTALRSRAEAAGVRGFHVHVLRHTFADRWKARGGSEDDLMRLGGWQDPTVMRRYGAARAVDRALRAYDEIDPLDDL